MHLFVFRFLCITIPILIGFGCSGEGPYSGATGEIVWSVEVEPGEILGQKTIVLRGLLNGKKIDSDEIRTLKVIEIRYLDLENALIARHESATAKIEDGAICIRLNEPPRSELSCLECSLTIWLKESRQFRDQHYDGMFTSRIPLDVLRDQSK